MTFKLLLLYIITLPLMKTPNLPLLEQRLQLSEIVFLSFFLLWLKDWIKNRKPLQDTGINKPFLFFIVFCLLSFFHSSDLFLSTIELLGLIYLFVMLILVVDIVDKKRKLDTIIRVWIGTLAGVLALGIIGLCICIISGESNIFCRVYHGNFPYLKFVYRVQSTFKGPSGMANYLIVSLGFVVSDLLLTKNKRYKLFLKIMIFFIALTVFSTISRNILGFMVSSFLIYNYFIKQKGLKFRIIRFLSISLIITTFLFFAIFCSSFYIRSCKIEHFSGETYRELVVNIDYAHDTHLVNKIAALEMIKRHPFLGVGLAMFPSYVQRLNNENYFKNFFPIYYYPSNKCNFLPPGDPHNDILQYLAETGILGGGAFVIFIATFLYLIFTNMKKEKTDNHYFKIRLFCFLASFIGVFINSIDVNLFKFRHLWFLMALTLALIMTHKNKIDRLN